MPLKNHCEHTKYHTMSVLLPSLFYNYLSCMPCLVVLLQQPNRLAIVKIQRGFLEPQETPLKYAPE